MSSGNAAYSPDGRRVAFEIWKIPADGGTPVQVTRGGGFYAVESEDGRELYYSKSSRSGIWRVLLSGGGESEVVTVPVAWADWALGRRGLYYATGQGVSARRGVFTIQFLDFGSGQTTPLFRSEGIATHFSMAVSPDEKWILFGEAPGWQSELMLMENFR